MGDLLIKKPQCTVLSPRCNRKELMPVLSEIPQEKAPCINFTLCCALTQNKQNLLWVSESFPVLEHPTLGQEHRAMSWWAETSPEFCLFQDVKCACYTPKSCPKAVSRGTGTHQDVSHLCHTGHQWGISHPTFCPGDTGRSSPGHIHCISLVLFLENMLIFSYRGLDWWPLLPTVFALINSELYSKKALREEQPPATIRQ